jgi:hypothetical protein
MLVSYTFIKPPAMLLTEHLRDAYPGLSRIAALYYDEENDGLFWYISLKEDNYDCFPASEELNSIRKPIKQSYNWLDTYSIPINQDIKKKSDITIFDESAKLMLSMRFTNAYDMMHDIIYAEFNNSSSFWGLSKSKLEITAEKKAIIGEFVYSGLLSILKRHQKDYELWQKLSKQVKSMHHISNNYRKSLEKEKEAYKHSIERLIKEYVNNYSRELGRKIIISKDAMQSLREYSGELIVLKDIIKDAIVFSANLTDASAELIIETSYINYSISNIDNQATSISIKQTHEKSKPGINRETRATQYLYRLSEAVEKLISQGEKITGSNVGAACNPPVSAPAISDFLTKYRIPIKNIILSDPSRWKLLTRHFKPISNIMDSPAVSAINSL